MQKLWIGILLTLIWAPKAWTYSLIDPLLSTEKGQYGPNQTLKVSTLLPINPGGWLPLLDAQYAYTWIEPLQNSKLGEIVQPNQQWIRFESIAALSPYYNAFSAFLGIRLIPRFELAAQYQIMNYHGSNVEQASPSINNGLTIGETWRSDYIWDHMEKWTLEYTQSFGFLAYVDLSVDKQDIGFEYRFYLINVETNKLGKSIEYISMLPVDDRDFYMQVMAHWKSPLSSQWSSILQVKYEQTGLRGSYFGVYDKQAVPQGFWMGGAEYHASKNSSWLVQAGMLMRSEEYRSLNWSEHILMRFSYQNRLHLFDRDCVD